MQDIQPGPVRPGRDREVQLARLLPTRTGRSSRHDRRLQDRGDGEDRVRARRHTAASEVLRRAAREGRRRRRSTRPGRSRSRSWGSARTPTGFRSASPRRGRHREGDDRLRAVQQGRTDVAIIFFGIGGPLPSRLEQQASRARRLARLTRHSRSHLIPRIRRLSWLLSARRPARIIFFADLKTTLKRGIGRGGALEGNGHSDTAAGGAVADDAVPGRRAGRATRASASSGASCCGGARRDRDARGRIRRGPLPVVPPEGRRSPGAHEGREGGADRSSVRRPSRATPRSRS